MYECFECGCSYLKDLGDKPSLDRAWVSSDYLKHEKIRFCSFECCECFDRRNQLLDNLVNSEEIYDISSVYSGYITDIKKYIDLSLIVYAKTTIEKLSRAINHSLDLYIWSVEHRIDSFKISVSNYTNMLICLGNQGYQLPECWTKLHDSVIKCIDCYKYCKLNNLTYTGVEICEFASFYEVLLKTRCDTSQLAGKIYDLEGLCISAYENACMKRNSTEYFRCISFRFLQALHNSKYDLFEYRTRLYSVVKAEVLIFVRNNGNNCFPFKANQFKSHCMILGNDCCVDDLKTLINTAETIQNKFDEEKRRIEEEKKRQRAEQRKLKAEENRKKKEEARRKEEFLAIAAELEKSRVKRNMQQRLAREKKERMRSIRIAIIGILLLIGIIFLLSYF